MPMNPQERDVISGIFERLKQGANAPREAEAEKFINDQMAAQPYAPYVMTQSLYVQEQTISNMQTRIKELELQLQAAHELRPPNAPAAQGGFFSSIFGSSSAPAATPWVRGSAPAQPQNTPAPPQGGPLGAPQATTPAGGGFMASALTTAAGVAGGVLAANALSSMFSGHHGQSSGFMSDANQSNAGYNDGYADAQQDAADYDDNSGGSDSYDV